MEWAILSSDNESGVFSTPGDSGTIIADVWLLASHITQTSIPSLALTYTDSRGRRVTTETAYLTPSVVSRPNLTVATHASATKILFEVTGPTKRAVGVEFARDRESARYSVKAGKEVILSAGAVHTPHLLMVSGIGPAAHLRANSIPVVHDLPGPANALEKLYGTYKLVQWLVTGKGPIATNIDPVLFPPSEYTEEIEDTTSSASAPDIELFSSPFAWKKDYSTLFDLPKGEMGTVAAVLL
ncbi:hypothetical protein M0805_001919, partial [Coniferiporia weirii]